MRSAWRTVSLAILAVVLAALWCHAADAPAKAEAPKAAAKAEKARPPAEAKADEVEKVTAAAPDKPYAPPAKPRKLLIFSLAKGFAHSSIPIGGKAFEIMGKKTGAWDSVITTDVSFFAPDKLKEFDAVMMNNTTGKDLIADPALKQSLLDFVKGGHGIGGAHSATDAFYEKWPEYGEMMGGLFVGHPFRRISVKLDDPASPLTAMFDGKGFEISDEIYTFKDPYSREKLRILLSIDWENANLSKGNRPDNDYALSWIREYGKGRTFYCAFGHEHQIFWNPTILKHYLAGIQYILGDLKADATPSAKLTLRPARGPVLGAAPEKTKPAPKVNKAPVAAATAAATAEPSGLFLKPDAQGWITLFDGKNLDAFQAPAAGKWKVVDGILTW